jgi:trehalose 6-phosphate synthase/phosphatase
MFWWRRWWEGTEVYTLGSAAKLRWRCSAEISPDGVLPVMTGAETGPRFESSTLAVVSNRLPFSAERRHGGLSLTRSPGGLVAALDPVLKRLGGVWVGWPGVPQEDVEAAGGVTIPPEDGVCYRPVALSAREVSQYYSGFSNRTLWPLFHYFVGRTKIDSTTWRAYERVNERFAAAVAEDARRGALVWVHDYQLLLVPHFLRRLAPDARIAFYLHIPFPAADVFRVLPWSRSLLRGMLASDLVGFQIPAYAQHFLSCAERLLGCEVDRAAGLVRGEGREVSVQVHPISVDTGAIEALAGRASTGAAPTEPMLEVLGVDRLDYTKGLQDRLLAVERFFERYPVYHERVQFTQLLVPSRERVAEYSQLKREIDETVGRINGRFSEPGWTPIRYFVRSLPPEELVPLYRRADVALVTPLRDGMNLVAKEYVTAQLENDGVLILSEMAGAAEELQEALIVNPFDVDAVAEALHRALSMPEDERRARMSALRDRVRAHDVHAWVNRFLDGAAAAVRHARMVGTSPVEPVLRRLAPWLEQRPTLGLFVDYDGTLTPLVARPEDARLSDATRKVLDEARRTPSVDIVIVSGRSLADVKEIVGVPGITYVGNHGFEIEGPGINYVYPGTERFLATLAGAATDLRALDQEGAWVEHKGVTLTYHLRAVPGPLRERAQQHAERVLRKRRLRVVTGHDAVEGRPPVDWHKGHAVLYVLVRRHGVQWPARVRALYVGDDETDEDAFRSLSGIGRSICVSPVVPAAGTAADFRLPGPDAVAQLLRWLASGAFASTAR